MTFKKIALTLTVLMVSASGVSASVMWNRPGTVGHCLTLSEGARTILDLVVISKIKAKQEIKYITVQERTAKDRIIVLMQPSSLLRLMQQVDIEGTVVILPSGEKALTDVTIWGYANENGSLFLRQGPPIVKGMFEPTPWPYKVDLTVRSTGDNTALEPASPDEPNTDLEYPSYYTNIADILENDNIQTQGVRAQSYYDSIPDVRGLPDGSLVELQAKGITATGIENIGGTDYTYIDLIENPPATDTIRAYFSGYTVSANDRVNMITGQILHTDPETPVICVNNGPGYDPQILEGQLQTAAEGKISWAKTFPDSTVLPAALENKVVSRVFPSTGIFYIQEQMRDSGIRIYDQTSAQTLQPGDLLTISGSSISSQNGERVLIPGSVTVTGTTNPPRPLGLENKLLGGKDFNIYTTGITGCSQTHNLGLFVRIWGRVTSVGSDYFYLDDGSNVDNGPGNPRGVKVSWEWRGSQDGNPPIAAPEEGWYVCVNGISSCEISGQTVRVLRLRRQEDLQIIYPQDNTAPYVEITTPPGSEINKASDATIVKLAGTATDADTGIASVQVGFTATGVTYPPTTWSVAEYDRATHVWTYDWQNPPLQQPLKIWVHAVDRAGKTGDHSRDNVTVYSVDVVYVSKTGDDTTGYSWATAKRTITEGITAASGGGYERWVAAGTYHENVSLVNGVPLYGAFSGSESIRQTERPWSVNQTIIQGDGLDSVIYAGPGITNSTVLDGFTISGGLGHYIEELNGFYGAGICCKNASPVISHNVVSGNGDGMYISGAGIACYGGSPSIIDNTISGNQGAYGGGIYLDSITSGMIRNNTITRNNANTGGGIYCNNSAGRFSNNAITYNSTNYYDGGGIYCYNYESSSAPEIVNNTIAYNTCPGIGGGIICDSCSPTIVNNIMLSNSSGQVMKYGSANPIIHTNCIYGDVPYSGWYPDPTQDILADPLLVGVLIQTGSPCLNTGENSVVQSGDTDIDGQPRKQPISDPNAVVDIGADEWCQADVGVILPVSTTELDYFASGISYCGN